MSPFSVPNPAKLARGRVIRGWRLRFTRYLALTDLLVLIVAVYGAQFLWFGLGNAQVSMRQDARFNVGSYWIFSTVLVIVWMIALALVNSRDYRVIGSGTTEYVRIFSVSMRVFGLTAIVAFLFRIDVARGYLLISLPVGLFLLILTRWLWRKWLIRKRRRGEYSSRVLLLGSSDASRQIAAELARDFSAGYLVVGACVPGADRGGFLPGTEIPVLGGVDDVAEAMRDSKADTLTVTSSEELPPNKVKQLSWALEKGKEHLVLAPSIIDIAGPRMETRPVAGLPLIHVETPRFSTGQKVGKRFTDLILSAAAIVVLALPMLIIALVVKLTSKGPVFFTQQRVGYHGKKFTMLKFRSMVPDAEARLEALKAEATQDMGNDMLFKMKDDPRVTKVGKFLRRYSIDELPQLFNVFVGSMSLVGPRPPLPSEVEQYEDHVHRRFLAKPGVTGLWQVSGRSTLSWQESVRLDLFYVENWTLVGDLVIMIKTVKTMVAPGETAS